MAKLRQALADWARGWYSTRSDHGSVGPDLFSELTNEAERLAESLDVSYGLTREEKDEWLKEFLRDLENEIGGVKRKDVDAPSPVSSSVAEPTQESIDTSYKPDGSLDLDLGPVEGSLRIEEEMNTTKLEVIDQ